MRSKIIRLICWVAGLMLAVVAGAWLFHVYLGPSGPGYHATDHDSRLIRVAKTAATAKQALEQYHHDHSSYPGALAALTPYLPPGSLSPKWRGIKGWTYDRHTGDPGYSLTCSLGWDPILIYDYDGTKSRWTYDPGDGSDTQTILLDP